MNEILTLTKRTVEMLNSNRTRKLFSDAQSGSVTVELCGECHKPQYVSHPEQTDMWHCDLCLTYNVVDIEP